MTARWLWHRSSAAGLMILFQAGVGAGVVEIAARRPGGANCADHLVADFDNDAPAEQQ
jgi:hypothetical protein